ncbi:MAG: DUF4091 domain-containing protein, partial [Armatimonadetes bacterium]|nr:DUF4091 domain-containing protein [Armatimonadota bacterium]
PLPPLTAPLDLPAGRNQPLWIRVNVPKATPPGEYTGAVRLSASGYQAEVPLRLRVYGFELPDRMTVTTAFGFSPNTAFQYQGLTTAEQRREVLAKYLANYSAHHISPYDPAPLDAFQVNWPQLQGEWQGGVRDPAEKHAGATSLKLVDDSEKTTASAAYGQPITIPDGGVRFRFWYKTAAPNHPFIVTFNHHDADGRWMSGRNNDMRLVGNGQWQEFDRTITAFPPGAKRFQLTLRPVLWSEEGATTGTVWFDDLSLTSAAGEALVKGGDFEPLALGSLRPSIDWSQWDQAMTRAIDQYHFNSFRFPLQGLGGGTFHARVEPSLLGYPEGTPEYEAAFTHYVQQVEAHLAEKGWLDEAYIYWFDEPDPKDYEFVANGFRKLKEKAPGLRRMLTEQPEPELLGGPNIWCPVSDAFNAETARPRMAAGETFWWYVCTGPKAPYATLFIDHPGTEMRVWLWQTWQRGIEGILVWASNYWSSGAAYPDAKNPQNPYEDPMSWVSGYDTPAGTKRPWGNGDGRFVYPPEAAADGRPAQPVLDGPVDSIRWEMLRDGIEDYENFVILKRLLAERGASLPAAERARFEALLEVPASITTTATAFTKDPAPLTARREEMLAAIEVLAKR